MYVNSGTRKKGTKVTEEIRDAVISMYSSKRDYTNIQIAEVFGFSQTTIGKIVREYVDENNLQKQHSQRMGRMRKNGIIRMINESGGVGGDLVGRGEDQVTCRPDFNLWTEIKRELGAAVQRTQTHNLLNGIPATLDEFMIACNRSKKARGAEQIRRNESWVV